MQTEILNVVILYVTDATIGVCFLVGLAALVEYLAKRSLARILINLTPRQIANALVAQIGIVLLALIGFKWTVLHGGPGIQTHTILSTSNLTQGYSFAATIFGILLAATGLARILRLVIRAAKWVKY